VAQETECPVWLQYLGLASKSTGMNRTTIVILTFFLCVACQMDNRFSRLQTGMTKTQVLAIVGKRPTGDKTENGVETLQWETGSHYARFKNGRLTDYGSD
jgi:hypothetical protein